MNKSQKRIGIGGAVIMFTILVSFLPLMHVHALFSTTLLQPFPLWFALIAHLMLYTRSYILSYATTAQKGKIQPQKNFMKSNIFNEASIIQNTIEITPGARSLKALRQAFLSSSTDTIEKD